MVLADGSPSGVRREWCGEVPRVTTILSLRRVGAELPQALAVASVRPQAYAMDSTHSVRSLLFNDFENRFGLGKIDAHIKKTSIWMPFCFHT